MEKLFKHSIDTFKGMGSRIDEIDRRILYRLVQDSRNTSTPEIAEEVNVSPGTIRNRINQLEDEGIILGYHANINYEKVGNRLVNLFKCSSSVRNRQKLVKKVLQVPGVIGVSEIMSGDEDLHIKAVAESTEDIRRIANDLIELNIEITDEDLVLREYFHPYHKFGPKGKKIESMVDFRRITGGAETANFTVPEGVPVEGKTVKEINDMGLLDRNALLLAVEREDKTITPKGNTTIKTGDIVTIFSPTGIAKETLRAFTTLEKNR